MTRKDYWKFAEMLKNTPHLHDDAAESMWERIVIRTANIFQEDNPRFNRERFYEACGLEE